MAADAGYVCDCHAIGAWLKGHAIVVVRNLYVVDDDVGAGADVEAVCVLGGIGAFRCRVHCERCEGDVVGATFDGVEDVGGILLAEVGDCYV